ncbi:Kinase [Hexamita inflata]|uniref:CAMK CAMKL n=1 Tax=Hexamita inflata TaxID=28002 RepID=A0AA86PEM0_9EUKA|nr:CAMK CAMKL [Hexamita inflata]CAI9934685.1 CAMK CAMKL [Hexamita inflata]
MNCVLLIVDNTQTSINQLNILQKLEAQDSFIKLLQCFVVQSVNYQKLSKQHVKKHKNLLQSNKIFVISEYPDFSPISNQIFTTNNQRCSASFSTESFQSPQQEDMYQIFSLFKNILESIQDINKCGVYLQNIQPKSILTNGQDFKIYSFWNLVYQPEISKYIIDPLIENQSIGKPYSASKFSAYQFDNVEGYQLCEPSEVYNIGAIIYYVLTDRVLEQNGKAQLFAESLKTFGPLVTDLICGMTHPDCGLRYTITTALCHPVFNYFSPNYQQYIPNLTWLDVLSTQSIYKQWLIDEYETFPEELTSNYGSNSIIDIIKQLKLLIPFFQNNYFKIAEKIQRKQINNRSQSQCNIKKYDSSKSIFTNSYKSKISHFQISPNNFQQQQNEALKQRKSLLNNYVLGYLRNSKSAMQYNVDIQVLLSTRGFTGSHNIQELSIISEISSDIEANQSEYQNTYKNDFLELIDDEFLKCDILDVEQVLSNDLTDESIDI